jgi:23S rRNA (uracil1939-C5)-methyltransferase
MRVFPWFTPPIDLFCTTWITQVVTYNAMSTRLPLQPDWRQGAVLELIVTDLSNTGDGVAHWGTEHRAVFIPDTVPGDRISARLTYVKPRYAHGQKLELLESSPHRIRPHCIVADKCGGCQWQPVAYSYQLESKQNAVRQALERIGKLSAPPVSEILAAPEPFHYRNKVTYPLAESLQEGRRVVQAGYYQKSSHRLVNLNQCPVQDERLNPLLSYLKQAIQAQQWSIYDEETHSGELRHLSLRIGRRTGEILVTLVARTGDLPDLEKQVMLWQKDFPAIVGICLNLNPDRTNRIFGNDTRCLLGKSYLVEKFAGLTLEIHVTTFFQVYTEQAEVLVQKIIERLNLNGTERVLDAYSGVGTLTLPLAQRVQHCVGIEVQEEAVAQAQRNAERNQIQNATFQIGTVEKVVSEIEGDWNIILLDPPRKGCDPIVLEQIKQRRIQRIVYVSCNPATLARDLQLLCQDGSYRLAEALPADFFPQTSHVECAAFLEWTGDNHD